MQLETNDLVNSRRRSKARKKKLYRKRMTILIIAFLFIGAILIGGFRAVTIYSTVKKYDSLIYPGVFIDGVNVGGKTKEEALTLLSQKHKDINKDRNIIVQVAGKKYTVNFSELNMEYNYDEVIKSAFTMHRSGNALDKYKSIKKPKNEELSLKYKYSMEKVDQMINTIKQQNNREAVNASIVKNSSGSFSIKGGSSGQVVEYKNIKEQIQENMTSKHNGDIVINSSIKEVKPHISESELKTIDTNIATYTTNFGSSNENRVTNVTLAASAINGKVLMPGDEFSFNNVVGQRTEQKGYKPAKVIVGDKLIDDFGGGICQVSSTLYNAIMRANIPSTERANHTLKSSYVPMGMDATVDFGNIDYKFVNTLQYPVYIETLVKNKTITVNVYSNKSLTNKKYDLANEISGNKVKVYKITYQNGKEIDRKLVSTDTYKH